MWSNFARVSPTARYTGAVWRRHGLSPAALHPLPDRVLAAGMRLSAPLRPDPLLEGLLLARHVAIDALLTRAIVDGGVSQVIELAAGQSARGWRFKQRFGTGLRYIETDLPAMAARKQRALQRGGLLSSGHEVRALDAGVTTGPLSLRTLLGALAPDRGVAIISEGLLNYLPLQTVDQLWQDASAGMRRFPASLYLADTYLASDNGDLLTRGFLAALSVMVRGAVRLHFTDAGALHARARRDGWRSSALLAPDAVAGSEAGGSGATGRVRILCASAHDRLPGA